MIHFIKNIIMFLIITVNDLATSCSTSNRPSNPHFISCTSDMIIRFGRSDEYPLVCIKKAIREMSTFETYSDYVAYYYQLFSGQLQTDDIREQKEFCNEIVQSVDANDQDASDLEASLSSFITEKDFQLKKCLQELENFGDSKRDILENAIFVHKIIHDVDEIQTDDPNDKDLAASKAKFYHLPDTFSYKYLEDIEVSIFLFKPTSNIVNPITFCEKYYGDKKYQNSESASEV